MLFSVAAVSLSFFLVPENVFASPLHGRGSEELPVLSDLRIEGLHRTIYEGPILTRGHTVTTPSGGSHDCNGLNLHANPKPSGTCTTALDDAAHFAHFSFDGTFDDEFDDFFITSIAGDTETDTQFWGLLLNFQFTPVGGCQQEVKSGDHVLWAFDAFNANAFLKLEGPTTAKINEPVILTVTNGSSGLPIEGAVVDGRESDSNGHITLRFASLGARALKAERTDAIRSNRLIVLVL